MKDDSKNKLDSIAAKGEGFTVPQGYFDDFAIKMSSRLPYRQELDDADAAEKERKKQSSRWYTIRPYVYMAAMFAGAWCMLKMFSLMTNKDTEINIDNYPSLTHALQNDQLVDDYLVDDISPYEIIDDYYDEGMVCIPVSADEIDAMLQKQADIDIQNVRALTGDDQTQQ